MGGFAIVDRKRQLRVGIDVSAVPAKPAGAGRYVIELVKQFREIQSFELALLARRDDPERWRLLVPQATVKPVVPIARPLRLLWEQAGLPFVVSFANLGIYHGPHYTMPVLMRTPAVVTIHDMFFFSNPEWHERKKVEFFKRAIEKSIVSAKGLIAISEFTANAVRQHFGKVDITVIPHGVDHSRFFASPLDDIGGNMARSDRTVLDEFRIPQRYIAFVGTKEPRKNLPSLIRAFDMVAGADRTMHLVLAGGEGWEPRELDESIAAAKHRDRIVQTGFFPERAVPSLLRRARVVAYPAFAEGFGLPALEALACGAPLVTTAGSAMQEVCSNAAIYFDAHDHVALANALMSVLQDSREEDRLRKVGPMVAQRFTWERSAQLHATLYRRIASRH